MAKAQHLGTCQICGRLQAYKNGHIAQHGYTVDYGFFNGVCDGSDHKALEEDRSVATIMMLTIKNRLDDLAAKIALGPEAIEKVVVEYRKGGVRRNSYMNRQEYQEFIDENQVVHFRTFESLQENEFITLKNRSYQLGVYRNELTARIERVYGTPLRERELDERPKPTREVYSTYRKACERVKELTEKGFTAHTRRIRNGGGYGVYFVKEGA